MYACYEINEVQQRKRIRSFNNVSRECKKNNELSFCTSNATANSKHVKQLFYISAVVTMPVVTDFFLIT